MPRKRKLPKQRIVNKEASPEDLQAFIKEADQVKNMSQSEGWRILERDLTNYRNSIVNRLAYTDPSRPEHKEARILFIAIDKIFSMMEDYLENRDNAIHLLQRLENPNISVTMDVDNE